MALLRVWLSDGTRVYGDFDWKFCRELFGWGTIDHYFVCENGSQEWISATEHPKIGSIPKSVREKLDEYAGFSPARKPFDWEAQAIETLGGPPLTIDVGGSVIRRIINSLLDEKGGTVSPEFAWRLRVRSEYQWKFDPASDRQISYLREIGKLKKGQMTKGGASILIEEPATEAQERRLEFYGCSGLILTKKEASEVIDSHLSAFPDSEAKYQEWKASQVHPAGIFSGIASMFGRK